MKPPLAIILLAATTAAGAQTFHVSTLPDGPKPSYSLSGDLGLTGEVTTATSTAPVARETKAEKTVAVSASDAPKSAPAFSAVPMATFGVLGLSVGLVAVRRRLPVPKTRSV